MTPLRPLALVAAAVFAAGCSAAPRPDSGPVASGLAAGRYAREAVPESARLFPPAAVSVDGGVCLVALRSTILEGALDLRVRDGAGRLLGSRRVARPGENLHLIAVVPPPDRQMLIECVQTARAGSVDVEIAGIDVWATTPEAVGGMAERISREFERATNRIADPSAENLVPNADFAEDDDVRGTPADWSAYVTTEVVPGAHSVRAAGAPPPGRPYLATGPIPVEPGARYRASCRVGAQSGAVVFLAMDYDEMREIAAAAPVSAGDEGERSLELEAGGTRAVRLWLAPPAPGAAATFDLREMRLERLPDGAR
jgi:hypothetical protein